MIEKKKKHECIQEDIANNYIGHEVIRGISSSRSTTSSTTTSSTSYEKVVPSSDVSHPKKEELKPYKCPIRHCNYRSSRADNMTLHLRVHTGEKPFICTFAGCNYRCTQAGTLAAHKRIHDGVRPFQCSYKGCDYRSTQTSAVIRHCRSKHKDDPSAYWTRTKSSSGSSTTTTSTNTRTSSSNNTMQEILAPSSSIISSTSSTAIGYTTGSLSMAHYKEKLQLQPCDFLVQCILDTLGRVFGEKRK